MKVRICFIVMFLMCFASLGFAKQFTDNEYGYMITIPDAWKDVPIHNDGTLPEERYSCQYINIEKKATSFNAGRNGAFCNEQKYTYIV